MVLTLESQSLEEPKNNQGNVVFLVVILNHFSIFLLVWFVQLQQYCMAAISIPCSLSLSRS